MIGGQSAAVSQFILNEPFHAEASSGFNHSKYPWIEWDQSSLSGKLLHTPERADIPENITEQLIVELYSK
jgi:small subunit ribosomal protein S4